MRVERAPLPPAAWRAAGELIAFQGQRLFVSAQGQGPAVLALHAFPTASYDYHKVVARLQDRFRLIVFDYPGFGFSAKPRRYPYSLFTYADAAETVAAHFGLGPVHVLAHDIGDSVALELLRRGRLSVTSLALLNGSVWSIPFTDWRLRLPQQLSLHPVSGPLISRWRLFRRGALRAFFDRIFVQRPSTAELAAFWELMAHNDGPAIYHQLMGYMPERWQHQTAWLAALRAHPSPLALIWGLADPVATPAVADKVLELRPNADCLRLTQVGHYPQWEVPDTVAATLAAFWRRAGSSTSST